MYFFFSAIVFLGAAALHGIRAAFGWELIIDEYAVPNWVSAIAFVVTAFLAYSGFKKLRTRQDDLGEH